MTDTNAGWGFPYRARRAHWFDVNATESLCGGWFYTGVRDRDPAPTPDDCRACTRLLERRRDERERVR